MVVSRPDSATFGIGQWLMEAHVIDKHVLECSDKVETEIYEAIRESHRG